MNIIKKIEVSNIKGIEKLVLRFDDLCANIPNILVAPNGFGKSTIALAFESASHGTIKLKEKFLYNNCEPELIIELDGECDGIYYSNLHDYNLSRKICIYVINSPLYAKNTGRRFNSFVTKSANLMIEDIVVYDRIPNKNDFEKYLIFKKNKEYINEVLNDFNTTGRSIKAHERKGKLVIELGDAEQMSNGERDVLAFVTNLIKFKINFNKKIGILIIDEVFDYLDGANMLAAQYFLIKFITEIKRDNKIVFPIIFTHLDPDIFGNYYFKSKKIHYLLDKPIRNDKQFMNIIVARGITDNINAKKHIEKYFLHYSPNEICIEDCFATNEIRNYNIYTNITNTDFRKKCYDEVLEYLSNENYDPLKVILGVRLKIEEKAYDLADDKHKFIETHKTNKKLELVDSLPEVYYILQPVYNDALHLDNNVNNNKKKIRSLILKLDNLNIKSMIRDIFT